MIIIFIFICSDFFSFCLFFPYRPRWDMWGFDAYLVGFLLGEFFMCLFDFEAYLLLISGLFLWACWLRVKMLRNWMDTWVYWLAHWMCLRLCDSIGLIGLMDIFMLFLLLILVKSCYVCSCSFCEIKIHI